jgi:glyoxylase-like metal-dependent hydrolase (beta-lactamase superfamily II)
VIPCDSDSDGPTSRPCTDTVEVTVLGGGLGESVVVHVGDNNWLIIDSFRRNGQPAALEYLDQIGVSPASVKAVLASHWHQGPVTSAIRADVTDVTGVL